jgi:Ca-activated chloride channel family protein
MSQSPFARIGRASRGVRALLIIVALGACTRANEEGTRTQTAAEVAKPTLQGVPATSPASPNLAAPTLDDEALPPRAEISAQKSAGPGGIGLSGIGRGGGGYGVDQGRVSAAAPLRPSPSTASAPLVAEPKKMHAEFNTEAYRHIQQNPFLAVKDQPLSTFSVDVDTASYSNSRRFLSGGTLPPRDAVRVEEWINYFSYDYAPPTGDAPVAIHSEVSTCPWNPAHQLVRIGVKGKPVAASETPPRNLVFLLDVSGSMESPDKLPLLKNALGMLTNELRPEDKVSIVVYAGASGLVLPATSGARQGEIRAALGALEAGGSTNGGDGIRLAYKVAQENFVQGGINRVILATDGDFNVGTTSEGELVRLIEEKRRSGVFLTVLGFGTGNVKDSTMEMLADKGNGNYAYIDSLQEARKVLVKEAGATLITVAKDVKLQVEFNPAKVQSYRLVGYENRLLAKEDFNDDKKDAGEIGAGHTVTAFYEIVPVGTKEAKGTPSVDPLKYQTQGGLSSEAVSGELLTVKLRYKRPDSDTSTKISHVVRANVTPFASASPDQRFAAAVAEFALALRGGESAEGVSLERARSVAASFASERAPEERRELVGLIDRAITLRGQR